MDSFSLTNHPHRRLNILTGEWVLVSPHRTKRPWQGRVEGHPAEKGPSYDPGCYLCPGNVRAGGHKNPKYENTFAFDNDFSAILPGTPEAEFRDGLLTAKGEQGICRVLCFSPDHSLTLPEMSLEGIVKVIELWQNEYETLGSLPYVNHVMIFENKGEIQGCSNPHPHGQIWAQSSLPNEVLKKNTQQKKYYDQTGNSLLSDYLAQEMQSGERIVAKNEQMAALVPFWAVWPYEAMIIPLRHQQHIGQMTQAEKEAFASILKMLTAAYDRLFNVSFPYSSGIHQSPTDGDPHPEWHWHMSFYPPLLRSATVKKFMVGYEMFGEAQRDITPEWAAGRLRELAG